MWELPRVEPRLTLWKHRSTPETTATVWGPQQRLWVTACKARFSLCFVILRWGLHTPGRATVSELKQRCWRTRWAEYWPPGTPTS